MSFSFLIAGSGAADPNKPLFLGGLLTAGLVLLGAGMWLIWRERALGAASRTWPTAPGTIKSSHVAPYDADGIEKYVAKVTYDYTVRGKTYAGDCLRFGGYAGVRQKAQHDVDKYRVGARVEVRYAARQPQTSTLEPGIGGVNAGGLAIAAGGAGLLGLSLAIAILV
jgi:ribosomal protein L35AE/L33A